MRVIGDIDKNEFIDMCEECNSYLAYKIKDIKKSFGVYYIDCPVCGNKIEVINELAYNNKNIKRGGKIYV